MAAMPFGQGIAAMAAPTRTRNRDLNDPSLCSSRSTTLLH